jgi:phage replication-related protein YjqB (UPF0714/DUF867 family)
MEDVYDSFEKLSQMEHPGQDFRIRQRIGTSGIAILSIHGGEIEPGTTRLADAIAGQEHSFYTFEGTKSSGNLSLHITSTHFDEAAAMEIVCQSDIIISIHGSAGMQPVVLLGGLDDELKRQILRELNKSGFKAMDCADLSFSATDQNNICNLCGRGMGVQMEVSRGLRAMMYRDLTPEGRHHRTEVFVRFTEAVRRALKPFAVMYAQTHPLENTD